MAPTATADICDQYQQASVLPFQLASFGGLESFSGTVETVLAPSDNSKVREALESEGLGRVLVVDGGAGHSCALLGGNLAQLAVQNGWSGLVVIGCLRDVAEIRDQPLGVKALATHPRKSVKSGRGAVGVELNLGGLLVRPGQRLYADLDGVVILSEGEGS